MTCCPAPAFTALPALGPAQLWLDWSQQAGAHLARLPFDTARAQYAGAVRAGWMPRSMLAARDFERQLDTLERLTLGPWARQV